jgi:hypothetical protein
MRVRHEKGRIMTATRTSDPPVITRCPHMPNDGRSRRGFAWVYRFGQVSLVTCRRRECAPAEAGWHKVFELIR